MGYLLIIKTVIGAVTGDYHYEFSRYEVTSQYQCQLRGDEYARAMLVRIPDIDRISYSCVPAEGVK